MKNAVMILISAIIGVLTLAIAMTVDGRMNRSMEITGNLPSAVEETVEIMAVNTKYNINNVNEYIADLTENLASVLDTDSNIRVEVLKQDKEKGVLSVRVTEEFKHPNGQAGTVDCERTVILNKVEEPEPETYSVRFYLAKNQIGVGQCYKSYRVSAGDSLPIPENPVSQFGGFTGWCDVNDYLADFSLPVTQNLDYYAVWSSY